MQKKWITLAFTAIVTLPNFVAPDMALFLTPAQAQEQVAATPAQEWINATYAAIDKAILAKDYEALIAWQSADYTAVDAKGKINSREKANEELKQFFAQIPPLESVQTVVEKLENNDDGSLKATVLMTIKANIKGVGEKPIVLEIKGRSTDIWTPSADKNAYQMKVSTEIESVVTADGIVVPLG